MIGHWLERDGYLLLWTLCLILFCVFLWYYMKNLGIYPSVYYKDSDLLRFLTANLKQLEEPFTPAFWLQNNHIQTLFSSVVLPKEIQFNRTLFKLTDGGLLALDWVSEQSAHELSDRAPIIIVLPGLTSDAKSVANLCHLALTKGYRTVVFNKRGHGGSHLTTPKLQTFGDPTDLRQFVEHICLEYPASIVSAVGISAGSGLLASYLGEYGDTSLLTCGVAISPGYDAVDMFFKKGGIPLWYERLLLIGLKKLVRSHRIILKDCVNMDKALKSKSFVEFDKHVYCNISGHGDISEYWKDNNPMRNIRNISVPFMCVSSLDDPVCLRNHIPFKVFSEMDKVLLVTTEKGGHCGFREGWRSYSWSDKLAVDYVDTILLFNKS